MDLTLRAKAIGVGTVVAATLSTVAATATFYVARQYMVRQRTNVATTQVEAATRLVAASIAGGADTNQSLLAGASVLPGARALLNDGQNLYVSGVGVTLDNLPKEFVKALNSGRGVRQRLYLLDGPVAVVGFPIDSSVGSWFVGILSLNELSRTLGVLRTALLIGSLLGTLGGAAISLRFSRRVMEPLHDVSDAALAVSRGDFDRRIEVPSEPDLAQIATSFNAMTDAVKLRIDREARFGATVSHELRTPLTVIKGAADVVSAHKTSLPLYVQSTVDMLNDQISEFAKTLNDLIDLARYQSGGVRPQLESISTARLVDALAYKYSVDPRRIHVQDCEVLVDVRRVEQIFANIVKNAELYAGGIDLLSGFPSDDMFTLVFDDSGDGIPERDADRIFEPFVRGTQHSGIPGSGLGLAITREHARVMGGDISYERRSTGGSRFVVTFRMCIADNWIDGV